MKITNTQLKQIIKEELKKVLNEISPERQEQNALYHTMVEELISLVNEEGKMTPKDALVKLAQRVKKAPEQISEIFKKIMNELSYSQALGDHRMGGGVQVFKGGEYIGPHVGLDDQEFDDEGRQVR